MAELVSMLFRELPDILVFMLTEYQWRQVKVSLNIQYPDLARGVFESYVDV